MPMTSTVVAPAQGPAHPQQLQDRPENLQHDGHHLLQAHGVMVQAEHSQRLP